MLRFASFELPAGALFALAVAAIVACDDDGDEEDNNQFREDVVSCEEAVARLATCCPELDASRVICNYYYRHDVSTCGPSKTESVMPALSLAESRCVRTTTCEELVSRGVCARAQEAKPYRKRVVHEDGGQRIDETHKAVCP